MVWRILYICDWDVVSQFFCVLFVSRIFTVVSIYACLSMDLFLKYFVSYLSPYFQTASTIYNQILFSSRSFFIPQILFWIHIYKISLTKSFITKFTYCLSSSFPQFLIKITRQRQHFFDSNNFILLGFCVIAMNYVVVNLFVKSANALHSSVLSFCLS